MLLRLACSVSGKPQEVRDFCGKACVCWWSYQIYQIKKFGKDSNISSNLSNKRKRFMGDYSQIEIAK